MSETAKDRYFRAKDKFKERLKPIGGLYPSEAWHAYQKARQNAYRYGKPKDQDFKEIMSLYMDLRECVKPLIEDPNNDALADKAIALLDKIADHTEAFARTWTPK